MQNVRIQLHSTFGQLQLRAAAFMFWPALLGCVVLVVLTAIRQQRFGPGTLLSTLGGVPFIAVWAWVARNATGVFATSEGLELPGRKRTVAWRNVVEAHPIPLFGPIPVYRVTFSDGTAPLTFYTRERVERVIARFKSGAKIE